MQLHLEAHLNAYSRAPFYFDWVRDISPEGEYNPNVVWVRAKAKDKDNKIKFEWVPVNRNFLEDEKIARELKRISDLEKEFNFVLNKGNNSSGKQLTQVYAQDINNNQIRLNVASNVKGSTLALRKENGTIECAAPTQDLDAVNLQWFNNSSMTSEEIDNMLEEILNGQQ